MLLLTSRIYFIIFCLVWVSHLSFSLAPSFPTAQLQALHTLYDATNGEHWNWTRVGDTIPWNFSIPHPNPCVDKWQGITCNVQCFTGTKNSYCEILELDLDRHNLNGTLPDRLEFWGNLTTLTYLSLAYNSRIVGTIPHGLGKLSNLETLYLNNLDGLDVGPIPEIFATMTNLQLLDLSASQRNGTLPSSIFLLSTLVYLDLDGNYIDGTLAESLCGMVSLSYLFMGSNYLTGTLPNCFDQLVFLNTLALTKNRLFGSLPSTLYSLYQAESIYLDANFLHGTLSENIGHLTNLVALNLNNNGMTGMLPRQLTHLTQLKVLTFIFNQFSGNVPCANLSQAYMVLSTNANQLTGALDQCNLSQIVTLDVYKNYLTGTIPSHINASHSPLSEALIQRIYDVSPILKFPGVYEEVPHELFSNVTVNRLFYLSISNNYFTGRLPKWLYESPFLVSFYGDSNMLTGPIVEGVNSTSKCSFSVYYIDVNEFTGTIPDFIYQCQTLTNLRLPDNQFTGTISAELFINNRNLVEFAAYNNSFSGTIPVLPDSVYGTLRLAQLSLYSNEFTGTIPWGYFSIPTLSAFSLSQNCLSGSLSEQICNARSMSSLLLDGISSSTTCQQRLFPTNFANLNAFQLKHSIQGTIPACIFELPALHTLYLSGNGLVGSISSDINISSTLKSLRLSYNQLTGTIPNAIQERSWKILDLSYNKLKGHIASTLNKHIDPYPFFSSSSSESVYLDVNRLSGNIPSSLHNIHDISILNGNIFYCSLNRKELPVNDPKAISYTCGSENIEVIGISIGSVIFLAVLGVLLSWCFLKGVVIIWVKQYLRNINNWRHELLVEGIPGLKVFNHISKVSILITMVSTIGMLPLYRIINIFSSMFENKYGWEFSAIYMSGNIAGIVLIIAITLVLSLLFYWLNMTSNEVGEAHLLRKHGMQSIVLNRRILYRWLVLFVNFVCMVMLNSGYIAIVVYANHNDFTALTQLGLAVIKLVWNDFLLWRVLYHIKRFTNYRTDKTTSGDVMLMVTCLLFNNIIAPCVGTMFVSPSCFYNALVAIEPISAYYTYCTIYVRDPLNDEVRCMFTEIAKTTFSPPFIYSYNCASLLPVNYAAVFVYMALATGLIIPAIKIFAQIWYLKFLKRESKSPFIAKLIDQVIPYSCRPYQLNPPKHSSDINEDLLSIPHLFSRDHYVVRTIGLLAILISFGILYPPVGVMVTIAIVTTTMYEQLQIGRLLYDSKQLGYSWYKEKITLDVQGMGRAIQAAVLPMTLTASLLYGALIFDTIGDKGGFHNGLAAGIIMAVVPSLIWLGFFGVCWNSLNLNKESGPHKEIQLSVIVSNPILETNNINDQ